MRSKKRTVVILIVVIVMLLGFAGSLLVYRNKLSSENVKNTSSDNIAQSLSSTSNNRYFENFYDKPITDENIALDSIEVNRVQLGYDDENLSFEFKSKDEYMGSTYRFNILYKDIPLNSEEVRVLVDENGKARTLISREIPIKQLEKISTTPKVTQDEALNIAKETLGENFSEYKSPFGDEKSYPELIIYEINNKYILSYSINSGSFVCVINAENGNVVVCHSIMVSNSAEYEGQNGDIHQIFYDDYKDENYDIKNMLYDKEKNIYILDDVKQQFNMGDVFTIADIHSGKNKSAVDAMANTYRAVEYFKEKLNITFDKIFVQVNDTESIDNACGTSWKDNNKSYAMITFSIMSNKKQAQYSAYLDAVAHEYTHSVTNLKAFGSKGYNEDSNYFERNALMEAYSDIFGQLIEQKYTGETDWILFTTNGNRNLKNQKTYSKRRKTKDNKGTEDNDYGYAHYNSIIISHTAYLMSQDNDNKKYDNKYLLDYDQLGQLWYGSLKCLDEKSNFSDCRYAIEQSARELIEKGVLLEGNLKVIEQAFNDVEVDSDTVRHGVENSLKVTTSTATTPSDPVEITEIESTEATTPPTATELQITAVDLIDKSIPEIISLMNYEYQIIKTENDGYIYIQNQSVLPGMEFYIQVSGDDIIPASNGEELHSDSLKTNLESGKYPLDGIQVNQSGKIDDSISADMDYTECCKVLGNFNCVSGTGAYLSGAPSAVAYTYNVNNAEITLYFEITSDLITLLSLGEISSVSSEEMQSYNPHLMNVVIRKAEETSDLIVETVKLTNSDIKSEWTYVTSLDLEYPIFSTSDKELQIFLNTAITEKILSYMATDTDYNVNIFGGFEYDMSLNNHLSVNASVSNVAEGSNGFPCQCYTFFVDLQNRKVLTLNELFSEPENAVYNEIATKANQYISDDIKSGLLNKTALSDYDYRNCKFTLNKDNLTIIFNPYEVTAGAVGFVKIEIPISDLNLTCIIPEIKTKGFQNGNDSKMQSESAETQTDSTAVSDNEILKAVNKYLEENQSNLGVWSRKSIFKRLTAMV